MVLPGGCPGFNPRPPRKVGATPRAFVIVAVYVGFNPRPPRKVGATVSAVGSVPKSSVSILAHPERWALPTQHGTPRRMPRFQSSPTPKGGRYCARSSTSCGRSSFNPRPPRKVGATRRRGTQKSISILCFNPRPPRKVGATRDCRTFVRTFDRFQSSPTPKGGRYGVRGRCRGVNLLCFNPRPPRKVGATGRRGKAPARIQGFNPRPPRKVGATRKEDGTYRVTPGVSILAHPERWALQLPAIQAFIV